MKHKEVKEIVPESFWNNKDWSVYDQPTILRRKDGRDRIRKIREEMERHSFPRRMKFEEEMALFMGGAT